MADVYHLIISNRAASDLQQIHDYIAQDSPQNATTVARKIVAEIDSLTLMPQRHRVYAGRADFSTAIRRVAVWPYLIYYQVLEDRAVVRIVTVRDGRRRQPRKFD